MLLELEHDPSILIKLNNFMGEAAKATYASGGGTTTSQRAGFTELEYRDGDWYYRDSYTGYYRSWGQEVIWYKGKPFWTCLYGGGMNKQFMNDVEASETFAFLKQALLSGDKQKNFQPRGPKSFISDRWEYSSTLSGDISQFSGNEVITRDGLAVFTHTFLGGIVIEKK